MPFVLIRRSDIPNGVLRVSDLWPSKARSSEVYEPVPQGDRYLRQPDNNRVLVAVLGGDRVITRPSQGLAAYLLDSVEIDGQAMIASEAFDASLAIVSKMRSGELLSEPQLLEVINAIASNGSVSDFPGSLVLDTLRILSGDVYKVPKGTFIQRDGDKEPPAGDFESTSARSPEDPGFYNSPVFLDTETLRKSFSVGQLGKLSEGFEYKGVTSPLGVVYADNGILYGEGTPNEPMVLLYEPQSSNEFVEIWLGGSYDVVVDWGDGTVESYSGADIDPPSHTYAASDTYTVQILGTAESFRHLDGAEHLVACFSFGDLGVTNLSSAFRNAYNLMVAPDTLPSGVTDLSSMFRNADVFNSPIADWDTSSVTNMSEMFRGAENFNQPIGGWDVSNVETMHRMFGGAEAFDQPIEDWVTSKVVGMSRMFDGAENFNQPIGGWDVSNVEDMSRMFRDARKFNQPIGTWVTSKVALMDRMFADALEFDQNLGGWDVSNVEDMRAMFRSAESFNNGGVPSIGDWVTSKVTNMYDMFSSAKAFNQPIGGWDVSNVENMEAMFEGAESFNNGGNPDIGDWVPSNVLYMNWMFSEATSFDQDIGGWDVSSTVVMDSMFAGATAFNVGNNPIGISQWCVSNIPVAPNDFDLNTPNWDPKVGRQPVWGTCP